MQATKRFALELQTQMVNEGWERALSIRAAAGTEGGERARAPTIPALLPSLRLISLQFYQFDVHEKFSM